MKRITPNFHESEFCCKCDACRELVATANGMGFDGEGTYLILNFAFVRMLQKARNIAGIPFPINSGYRCHDHNKAIGSRADSSHPKGLAADIGVKNYGDRYIIVAALIQAGFTRMWVHKNHIHVDLDPSKVQPWFEVD